MKHLLWFAAILCATSAGAQRHITPAPHVSSASKPPSITCMREDAFEVAKVGGFADTSSYADRLFSSEAVPQQGWSPFRYGPEAPGCFSNRESMVWETADHLWLESMRPLPSYPNANNPAAFLSSGWRWVEDSDR